MSKLFGSDLGVGVSISGLWEVRLTISPSPKTGMHGEHSSTQSYHLDAEGLRALSDLLAEKQAQPKSA